MDNEIQLISDDDGLMVMGHAADVDRFLISEGLSPSQDLGSHWLKSVFDAGSAVAQAGSEMAENSGRWVKLTPKSAHLVKKYGLRESSKTGLGTGVLKGQKGQIKGFVEFAKAPRSLMTNPTALANAAKLMSQVAMQQSMEEISDYLATIDAKVDDVLRAQKDTVLSRMIGVGFVIDESMTIREKRGRVDEIMWSKVQDAPTAIAETQVYALRQLDAIADRMERRSTIGDLATAVREAEAPVREWLVVLARCFQLQDAIAVLELDRVQDASPDELDAHRLGLKAARQDRRDLISRSTERLVARMNAVAGRANAKVLLHPAKSPAVVQSSNQVAIGVHDFHERLGIESGGWSSDARRWADAAAEVRDKALETGAKGVDAARSRGKVTLDRAGSATGRLAVGIAERARRLRGGAPGGNEQV
ncbi:hypothetical protein [Streptomyces sp. Amel2xC10]|uniref:hypothetical protein n=1 Tax=Streptomyces sp. Amel2xC10 TaxID=1305826 RepID=UPI000A08E69A|nr:hypothetical protein [Streptomyces sp. Amel2xC10]SME94861.1 hypothetical protein SAMN02745830_00726 [Streptomyces sp. Amel2xC10]